MKAFKLVLAAVATIAALCICPSCSKQAEKIPNLLVQVGDRIPTFYVTNNSGERIYSADLQGKPTLIVFFSTTSPDCQELLPIVQGAYDKYGSSYFDYLIISCGEGEDIVGPYWEKNGFTMPYCPEETDKAYKRFVKEGVPAIFVVNSSNKVVYACADENYPKRAEYLVDYLAYANAY